MEADSDFSAFAEIWTAAYELKGKAATAEVVNLAFDALAGYTLQQVRQGLTAHIRDPDAWKFSPAPSPADVIRQIDGGADIQTARAWAKVDSAVRRVGPWERVAFDDPRIHAAVDAMGGWSQFFEAKDADWPHLQRRFAQQYQRWVGKVPESWPPVLVAEQATGDPRLIGDPKRAKLVIERGSGAGVPSISLEQHVAGLSRSLEAKP